MNKPKLRIMFCEENNEFAVVDISTNVWNTITNSTYNFETAIQIKKAYEEGYEKGKQSEVLDNDK